MKALILAAGYGTRLKALGEGTPKALLLINKKPLIDYTLSSIQNLPELNEVIVITNNKFYVKFQEWAAGHKDFGCPISIINDGSTSPEDRLGSIGDILFALKAKNIADDVLVLGSDNLFDYNVDECIIFGQQKAPAATIGLYDVGSLTEAKKFGIAQVAADRKLISFEEKPEAPKSTLAAMCFYYFPKDSLRYFDEYLKKSDKLDAAGSYIQWLYKASDVYGFKFEGKWYDIGSIESYNEAQRAFS